MHESCRASLNLDSSYFGYFCHFLATFGIENVSMITLLIFWYLKFAETMYNVEVDIIKLKITWSHMVIFHILKICQWGTAAKKF